MERIKNRLKSVFRLFWRRRYRVICICLTLAVLLGGVHYYVTGQQSNANISLNYSEASQGLNPNKTRFNSYEILSNEIFERAIELAGLQGSVSADELSQCVSLAPVDTGNASGDDDYISTTYYISLNAAPLKLKSRKAVDLLKSICNSYKSYFLENYCDNQEILKKKLDITDGSEPYIRLNEIKLRVKELSKYLTAREAETKTFTDETTGSNYTEIDKRLTNVINYDIPNTMAYIIESGVASDSAMLTKILEYKNRIDQKTADKSMAYYDADKEGIAMYEKAMTSVIMIPTTDELEEYYMSRTKTAMDNMARDADSALETATDYKEEIVSTAYIIQKISESTTDSEKLSSAREMINSLETALNQISDDLFVLDKAYIEYKAQNYITFNYHTPSFTQRIELKKTAVEILSLLACGFVIAYIGTGRKEKKAHEEV